MKATVFSPVVCGSGVEIVHRSLAKHIENYIFEPINPIRASIPALLNTYKCDSDIVHTIPDIGPTVFAKSAKNIITFHGYSIDEPYVRAQSDWKKRFYYRHFLRKKVVQSVKKASAITVVSNFLADMLKEDIGLSRNIHIIPNGVNLEAFRPIDRSTKEDRKFRLLFAGKLVGRKGFDAVETITQQMRGKIEVWAVGGGSKNQRPSGSLKIIPPVPHQEMPTLYHNVDALLFPSMREGFGLVIAEAMACGLPIISTNSSAIPELVVDNKGGYLCEFGDDDQMLNRLKLLASSPSSCVEFGQFNRERAISLFDEKKMINDYSDLFDGLA